VIVGGGLAGLGAAVGLAGRDVRVTLLESRPRLGGRASSFTDPVTGELVDNCQHVSMACCTNLADFCDRVGIRRLFRRVERLLFVDPEGRRSTWAADRLPAPFHLTRSLLGSRFLRFGEKLRIGRALAALRFARDDDPRSFDAWLIAHGQTPRIRARFWATILVSALNERLDRMDIGLARKVFLDGFLRNREGHVVEIPQVPLGELYGTRLESWLAGHGIDVRLTTGVRMLDLDAEGAFTGVWLRSGERVAADFVVLAVPFDRVGDLVPEPALDRLPGLKALAQMETTPITGIHLWFDREVCPVEHAVVVDRTIQWVFNHTAIQGRTPAAGDGQYLQLVVSAAYDLARREKTEIRDIALADLAALWPAAREATLLRWWVVTEHGATFSARPGVDRLRPDCRTEIEGLVLAGDWTATGWPATMEGAVRSGYRAAEVVLANLGRPTRLIRPDLPSERLGRLLFGRPRAQTRFRPESPLRASI
jgi:squalene-associated FAD-dependent desaturase